MEQTFFSKIEERIRNWFFPITHALRTKSIRGLIVEDDFTAIPTDKVELLKDIISNLKKENNLLLIGLIMNMCLSVILCLCIIF